jgi:energy-coupling factor transport system permease protein
MRFTIPAGAIVVIVPILSALAFAARDMKALAILTMIDCVFLLLVKGAFYPVLKEIRFFFIQTAIITGLYSLRFGFEDGLMPGLRVSWQLLLAFTPGIVMMKTVPHNKLVAVLEKIIPYRLAFVISTSLRFIPLLIAEARNIYEAQVLRGARIFLKDMANPLHWPDFINCVLVPVIVQGLKIAGEVSQSALSRGFGLREKRTHWSGSCSPSTRMEHTR